MSGHGHATAGGGLRQTTILILLIGAIVLLHHFATPTDALDSSAMLALGFVVLASYVIGQLAELVKLPHITGYLVAGLLFGPSVAHMLPSALAIPPFGRGLLNEGVTAQLNMLNVLAVALIAMTAGGELKIDTLRHGIRALLGTLLGQLVTIVSFVTVFVILVAGLVPAITLPGLEGVGTEAALALGLVVAAISLATSPAATIAVINDTGAEGPMSRTVLSVVVLKDVVVVIMFALSSVFASQALGIADGEQDVGRYLLVHIGGSLVVGALLGGGIALYLRFVGKEVLLFLVGVVYTASLIASSVHLDPVLMFLAAGFTTANFSREGDTLIESVEQLSTPVYVVFFTLAGAGLHLDELFLLLPYAIALVLVRAVALKVGVGIGTKLTGADPATRKHGWLGFLSQAGVAITLAGAVGAQLGEVGTALSTLIISGVALNELFGPILLKVGLGLAGEIPKESEEAPRLSRISIAPVALPDGEATPEAEDRAALPAWPRPVGRPDPWQDIAESSTGDLDELFADMRRESMTMVHRLVEGPLTAFQIDAETYLRELRREFLRHHRRLTVQSRSDDGNAKVAELLHAEQGELAEAVRSMVLRRAAVMRAAAWDGRETVESVDRLVESLPEDIEVLYEEPSFNYRSTDSIWRLAARFGLRIKRRWVRLFGDGEAERSLRIRMLARYHFGGKVPSRLESLAALMIQGESHLAARTRSLFDGIIHGYDELAQQAAADGSSIGDGLVALRLDVEKELALALDDVHSIVADGSDRATRVFATSLREMAADAAIFGTIDLPNRKRRSSKLFRARTASLEALTAGYAQSRQSVAAKYALLAMELELVGLVARIKDALDEHVTSLESDVRGRSVVQAERVKHALEEATDVIEEETAKDQDARTLEAALRQAAAPLDRVVAEATRAAWQLRDQLLDEATIAPLLDALVRSALSLTDRYRLPTGQGQKGEHHLAETVGIVDVPFRELVTAYVETTLGPELFRIARDFAGKVQPYGTSLVELERLVAFNVELATGELEVLGDEAVADGTRGLLQEMVVGGLVRHRELIGGHVDAARKWPLELGEAIREAVLGGIDGLRGQLVDGEISQLRVQMMRRAATGRRLMQRAGRLPALIAAAREPLRRFVRVLVGEERLEAGRKWIGLPDSAPITVPPANAFRPARARDDLPLVYRRLFSAQALEAADVLTGRDLDIERAVAALGSGPEGRLRTVALVGLDGIGKGAVTAAIVRHRAFRSVRRLKFTAPVSVEQVEEVFQARSEGQLVVVTGFKWLMAMRPGGFAPLRRFVSGVLDDGGKNAWLVQADQIVWGHATQLAALADCFSEVVNLRPLASAELEAAVLARHGLSGLGLAFAAPAADTPIGEWLVRHTSRIQRPYEAFFRSLHEASGGLVRDALRLWLAAIERVDETGDFVRLGSVPPSAQAAIRRLPEDVMLTLHQVARQGWMNADVHGHLFRVDRTTAEAQLARLANWGLLSEKGGNYRITLHLRGAVYRVLAERGWLS